MLRNLLLAGLLTLVNSVSLELDKLSPSEHSSIKELGNLLEGHLEHDYMKQDYYLAKWLIENNFDVQKSFQLMQKTLQWRKEENVDSILTEEWKDMEQLFPYSRNTTSKSGHPILYYDFGAWDVASFLSELPTNPARFSRYYIKILEESNRDVAQRREKDDSVTQFDILLNLGFSSAKHACVQCLYAYRDVSNMLATHYPLSTDKNIMVNVPYVFRTVYSILGDDVKSTISLYGQDESQWKQELLEFVNEHQIPAGLLQLEVPQKDNSEGLLQWNKEL